MRQPKKQDCPLHRSRTCSVQAGTNFAVAHRTQVECARKSSAHAARWLASEDQHALCSSTAARLTAVLSLSLSLSLQATFESIQFIVLLLWARLGRRATSRVDRSVPVIQRHTNQTGPT